MQPLKKRGYRLQTHVASRSVAEQDVIARRLLDGLREVANGLLELARREGSIALCLPIKQASAEARSTQARAAVFWGIP